MPFDNTSKLPSRNLVGKRGIPIAGKPSTWQRRRTKAGPYYTPSRPVKTEFRTENFENPTRKSCTATGNTELPVISSNFRWLLVGERLPAQPPVLGPRDRGGSKPGRRRPTGQKASSRKPTDRDCFDLARRSDQANCAVSCRQASCRHDWELAGPCHRFTSLAIHIRQRQRT